jgi:hypothetical protein
VQEVLPNIEKLIRKAKYGGLGPHSAVGPVIVTTTTTTTTTISNNMTCILSNLI